MNFPTFTVGILIAIATPAFGNLRGYAFSDKRDLAYSKDASLVFDASIQVVKREYRDKDGFKIDDKERIKNDVFVAEMDMYLGEAVRSIQYLVRFSNAEVVKGDAGSLKNLYWAYRNDTLSMCPHYPRDLVRGKRFRFYIRSIKDQRAYGVEMLESPTREAKSEQGGADQAAPAAGGKSEEKSKPKQEAKPRSR